MVHQHTKVSVAPPVTETFFNFPPAKNPTHWLSGEKKGWTPFGAGDGFSHQAIHCAQIDLLDTTLTCDISEVGAVGREGQSRAAIQTC